MPVHPQHKISDLLRLVAKEDEQAFRIVFDHFKEIFYATAFKMTRSGILAEEIVQEVFVALWIKRDLVAAADKPECYMFTILHNCIYAHFRKIAQERRLKIKLIEQAENDENIPEENIIENDLQEKEKRTIFENILNKLPPQQKLIYRLARQEGVTRDEIARRLNLSPNTVRNHLAAATEYLRSYFIKSLSEIILVFYWLPIF